MIRIDFKLLELTQCRTIYIFYKWSWLEMAIIKGEVLSEILESLIPAKIYHLMNQYFEYLSLKKWNINIHKQKVMILMFWLDTEWWVQYKFGDT